MARTIGKRVVGVTHKVGGESLPRISIKRIGKVYVQRSQIIGTNTFVFRAYEPSAIMGKHSTITSGRDFDRPGFFGRIGTARLPQHLESLPAGTDLRIRKVRAWQAKEDRRAYKLILQAFPGARGGKRRSGEIDKVLKHG